MNHIDYRRNELIDTAKAPHLWGLLAWYDIKQRYRRSVLGPFWMTLSTGIMIATLGAVWSLIFNMQIHEYLPFYAAGQVIWSFYAAQINEACTGFIQFEGLMKQTRLPLPAFILRLVIRNLIIFAHNFLVVAVVITFVGPGWSPTALVAIPGLLVASVAIFFISLCVAIPCTRFRDLQPVVQNLTMIGFYVTPILWQPKTLGAKFAWLVDLNPATHLLNIVRGPLLGEVPPLESWLWVACIIVVSGGIASLLLSRYRHRVAYWL
ncbi:ABC transporter permease [Burkholderia multivorans]|uniref:ABC transporter permease n=1 Tax=Burkholderia multivorans TaxID=87883 RepID=A0A228EKX6_9BURK|nr:ABC transporter permease [Burkholderia multivorans]MBU9503502.1 ABC transporter permease [Burkholderia multivorans]MBU9516262.1 ABC transporter permease [Burkholderia multivorans]MBU9525275.1 ABC transporter permease [Burkholderia multivorans]MBU9536832.1 ABC transporter permease [Burkholderia multivorans]MBU9638525.1 ABC transporter permease [Burkholderia multivorans]